MNASSKIEYPAQSPCAKRKRPAFGGNGIFESTPGTGTGIAWPWRVTSTRVTCRSRSRCGTDSSPITRSRQSAQGFCNTSPRAASPGAQYQVSTVGPGAGFKSWCVATT